MYTYNNGYSTISQEILPHFKRYHNCNAQYHINVFKGKEHGMSDRVDSECYTFISYSTWILIASHNSSGWVLYLNPHAYEYSGTTTRQLNRFLREYNIPITMKEIKEAIQESVKENTNIVWCNSIIIRIMSSNEISNMWHRIYR